MELTRYLWKEILLLRWHDSIRRQLKSKFHIDYDQMCKYLQENNAILSGYFLIACLFDSVLYDDLDVYLGSNSHHNENPITTFNRVFRDDFIPGIAFKTTLISSGTYRKTPVLLDTRTLTKFFPGTKNPHEQTIEYLRTLRTSDMSIDLVTVPGDPQNFIQKQTNMDFLKCWFDGKIITYPFDLYRWFFFERSGRLLQIGSIEFERYYDPWASTKCDTSFDDGTHPISDELYEKIDALVEKIPYNRLLPPKMLPQQYMKHARSCFIGSEQNVTDYRLLKTIYRCIKYMHRGINVTNLDKFFHTRIEKNKDLPKEFTRTSKRGIPCLVWNSNMSMPYVKEPRQ